jgi:IS30 family transposase
MSQFSISGRVIGGQRAAIPSEPSTRQGDLSHTRRPRVIETLRQPRNHPPQQRKERDLIAGPGHRSNIATLVERATRFTVLVPVPGSRHAELVHRGLVAALGTLPPELRRSITWDQGIEMSRHREVSADLGCPVFFCEKGKPWQRGTNENTNGLLRQYFPKGTDLSAHAPEHLRVVAHQLNRRPRAVLGGRTPAELFAALLPFPDHPLLRP